MFKISARTVLELGAELISSDLIAFYELIKNAFDAGSQNGAEIHFHVVLRKNTYLSLRRRAESPSIQLSNTETVIVNELIRDLTAGLDPSAGSDSIKTVLALVNEAKTLVEFIEKLDEAYRSVNTIEISDLGSGMSMLDLKQKYLLIGTPSRKRAVDRAIAEGTDKSPFLGEKGIGRLSAMRLGERLRVRTARSEDENLNLLDIDWRRFRDLDAMVEDIQIEPKVDGPKPSPTWSGTQIIVSDLSENWTEAKVADLASYDFARLTDPFFDPKARPRIAIFWNGSRSPINMMDRALLANAHASVRGSYAIKDGEPILHCKLEARDLGFPHPRELDKVNLTLPDIEAVVIGTSQMLPSSALTSIGPFEFEAYWYNRRHLGGIDSIGDQRTVRELQRKWSGILLFRDGFRILPYGDDNDDWLGLDRKALGRPGYALNKAQFVGHVNITRTGNPELVDQTNREGLRDNPEQQVFVNLLQHVIQGLLWDFLRDVQKRHKHEPIDLGEVKNEVSRLESRAKSALARIRKLLPKDEKAIVDDLQQAFLEFQNLTDQAQRRIAEVEADSRQMVQMAGVGLMVEVVAHELARATESALGALEALRGRDMPVEIRARIDTLRAEMKSVSKRLRVLDPLSVSLRQRSEVFDLRELVENLREGHAPQFQRHNINFHVDAPKGPIHIRAVKGLIVQILENLISNSVYWTQIRAKRELRYKPAIFVYIETDPLIISFSDNGPGIAPENREKIFRPFWSLKEKEKRRGLGLFIARENATYLGGQLVLSDQADPQTERLHKFFLQLPDGVLVR